MKTTHTKPSLPLDPDTMFAELLQDLPPETVELASECEADRGNPNLQRNERPPGNDHFGL